MVALIIIVIVLAIIVAVVLFGVTGFNKLRKDDIAAQEALGGIDVQLTRRADLIPNLVETVKGYAGHERGVLEGVTAARAGLQQAAQGDDVQAKAAADAQMQGALVRLNAVAEAYPDLKANTNYLDLQRQLAETENQISFARQYYNDAVATLNKDVATIPWMFFAGTAGVSKRDFYEAPQEALAVPKVSFGDSAPSAQVAAPAPQTPVVTPAPEAQQVNPPAAGSGPAFPPQAGEPGSRPE